MAIFDQVAKAPVRTEPFVSLSGCSVAFGCFALNFVSLTPVITVTFGLFLVPVTTEFAWPRAAFSAVLTIVAFAALVSYPVAGRLADRYGAARIVAFSFIPYALCLWLLGFVGKNLPLLYLVYAILGLLAGGPSAVLLAKITSAWFPKRRGLLFGLTGGLPISMSCTILPLISSKLIADHGWRTGYEALALVTTAVGIPALLLLRSAPKDKVEKAARLRAPETGLTAPAARRTPAFWLLLGSIALGAGSTNAILTHMVPVLIAHGVKIQPAVQSIAVMTAVNAVWQVVLGMLLDTSRTPRLCSMFMVAAGVGVIVFGSATQSIGFMTGAVLLGLGSGTEYGLLPVSLGRYFGLKAYAQIYGIIYGVLMTFTGIAPMLMDFAFDRLGSYDVAIWGFAFALVVSGLLIGMLPRFGDLPRQDHNVGSDVVLDPAF